MEKLTKKQRAAKPQELIVFIYFPLPLKVSKIVKRLQKEMGYHSLVDEVHITVYYCRFTLDAFRKLTKKIDKLKFKKIKINLTHLVSQKSKNSGQFYYLKTQNKNLQALHEQIIKLANPLRGKLQTSKELERIKLGVYKKRDLEYLNKYGFAYVLDRYNPHVTITDGINLPKKTTEALKTKIKTLPNNLEIKYFVVELLKYHKRYTKLYKKRYELRQ